MPPEQDLSSFIRSTFTSVWSLELLRVLRSNRDVAWTRADLVSAMRASDLVVTQSVSSLHAAGLVMLEGDGSARYHPVSDQVEELVVATEALYLSRPDKVRRIIVSPRAGHLASFANAFKLGES